MKDKPEKYSVNLPKDEKVKVTDKGNGEVSLHGGSLAWWGESEIPETIDLRAELALTKAVEQSKRKTQSSRNQRNASKRESKLPEAQAEAENRWARNPWLSKSEMAKNLEQAGYGGAEYLRRKLKKPQEK